MKLNLIKVLLLSYLFLACNVHAEIDIRIWQEPEQSKIIFESTEKLDFVVTKKSSDQYRLVLSGSSYNQLGKKLNVINNLPNFTKNYKFYKFKGNYCLDLFLQPGSILYSYAFPPNEIYKNRTIISIQSLSQFSIQQKEILSLFGGSDSTPVASKSAKQYTVVIDPGHGGEDPGAIGRRNTYEKNVVLEVSKKLKKQLQRKGFKVFMTRDGDYFVGLNKRIQLARKYKADLFVSIHADAYYNSSASGASVFVLSEKGASSSNAKWLANKENRSDLIGGLSIKDKNKYVAKVLLDMQRSSSIKSSLRFSKSILNNLFNVTNLHTQNVEYANFAVLKAPDIPSALIEVGFITNLKTEKMLTMPSYQYKLSSAISNSIVDYFNKI